MWCFVGDCPLRVRAAMSRHLQRASTITLPPLEGDETIVDYNIGTDGEWVPWHVPTVDFEMERIASGTDAVVPTLDTERHVDLMSNWLVDHLPVVLCGPPGSGKTMTLINALKELPEYDVALLNFSSSSSPEMGLKTLHQYCEYRRTPAGPVLAPTQSGKWLVVFCDEINLPAADDYATVRVITFLRQLVERGGFWRAEKLDFVSLERIQFVGACNPPTDPGRVPLSHRFLRHVPVLYVDYPSAASYKQIYGTFNRALLKRHPDIRHLADPLTDAMVDFFMQTQTRFTADMQPFYIYSPREMTRWVKGIKEAIWPLDVCSGEDLVRVWAHEALRLFQDRLVYDDERQWTEEKIDEVAAANFRGLSLDTALMLPILYSNWLSRDYVPVEQEAPREFVKARLKVLHEEELDVPLVLFNEVLDYVLRIDRIFHQNRRRHLAPPAARYCRFNWGKMVWNGAYSRAPADRSSSATAVWPLAMAAPRAVLPERSGSMGDGSLTWVPTSASSDSSSLTMERWPCWAATIRAVCPSVRAWLWSAPFFTSSRATSM